MKTKLPLTPEQEEWFAHQVQPEPNPCVRLFGKGPEGVTCKNCIHLQRRGTRRRNYFKCGFRKITNGPATDHRSGWDACARYMEDPTSNQ